LSSENISTGTKKTLLSFILGDTSDALGEFDNVGWAMTIIIVQHWYYIMA